MDVTEKSSKFIKPQRSYADTLRISPFAFAKMIFWRDYGETEVAAYATTKTNDPLFITDFRLIKQQCSFVTFDIDTEDLARDMEQTLDDGLCPWQTHNILCHSHPSNSPDPSDIDEKNFAKAFSHPDWAIMLIIAKDNSMYCRLKFNVGPGVEKLLDVEIDFNQNFSASNHSEWEEEYKSKVSQSKLSYPLSNSTQNVPLLDTELPLWQENHIDEETLMEIQDNCFFETTGEVTYWHDTEEVWYNYDPNTQQWSREDVFGGPSLSIPAPTQPWAQQVIAWANRNVNESDAMTIDELNSQIEQ